MTDRHPSLQTRDLVTAIQVVEGSFPSNEEEQLDAWQLLIDSGIVWQLQGTYAPRRDDPHREGASRSPGEGMSAYEVLPPLVGAQGEPIDVRVGSLVQWTHPNCQTQGVILKVKR